LAAYNLAVKGPSETDLATLRAKVEQAQAEVQTAQTAIAAHQQEVTILEVEIEQANLKVEQFQSGVDPPLTQAVEQAEQDLANTRLVAPFAGVVLEVFAKPGQRVNQETEVLLLADPTAAEVRSKVIEEDLPLVQIDQAAELFFDAQPLEAIPGRVTRLVPQRITGEDRPLYYVYITPDVLPSGVVAGMTADAAIIIAQRSAVLRLPRALVRPDAQGSAVVEVWEKSQKARHEVQVGLRGDVYVEIIKGLAEGDEIVGE
jgi:multidrug efflux pump subunit AcrA (membrane-fusion protein)